MELNQFIVNYLVYLLSCMIAIAMIIWGLRVYKFYIILIGIIIGSSLGIAIGGLIGSIQHTTLMGSTIGAIAFGIIGGILSWPLQKFFIFLSAGLSAGFLSVTISISFGLSGKNISLIIIGVVAFIFGIIMAIAFYEHVIIALMAYAGAISIFNLYIFFESAQLSAYKLPLLLEGIFKGNWKVPYELFINGYTDNMTGFILLIILFIGFALYFQLNIVPYLNSHPLEEDKLLFYKTTYLFLYLSLISSFSILLINYFFKSQDFFSDIMIFGLNIISWPVIIILFILLIKLFNININNDSSSTKLFQYIIITIIGITIMPFTTVIIYIIFYWNQITPERIFYQHFIAFYKTFFNAPLAIILTKFIYSFFILPGLFYSYVLNIKNNSE